MTPTLVLQKLKPSQLQGMLLTPGWVHTQQFVDDPHCALVLRDMTLGNVTLRHSVPLQLDSAAKVVNLPDNHQFFGWWLYGDYEIVNEDGSEADYPQDDLLTLVLEGCWASNPDASAHLFDLDLSVAFEAVVAKPESSR